MLAARRGILRQGRAGEEGLEPLFRDAAAVVNDFKHCPLPQREHPQRQAGHPLGVEHRVFQKVRQHLLDEHGVHRDNDEVIRKLYFHRYAGVELLEPHQHRIHQLFQHGGRLLDGDAVGVDAGDGEQILHHPVEPLGVGTGLGKELYLLLPAQRVVVVDDRRAGPVDGRQRSAQVVGDSPQEVGPHLLCLALHPQLLLLFDAGGQGTRHKGDHQHHHAGKDVLRDGEVEGKVGRAEREVDRQHADDRTGHAPPVAVGVHGNKKHRQQDKQHHAVKAGTDAAEYHFTNLHQPHRHHATKSGKRIMHRNHRAAGSRRSHDRKQATDQHAETALFTFHIDAAVRAVRQQMRITLNFCPHHYAYADDKNHRHRPQQHAPLATIARHFTKGKAQRCWDQENRQHLHEVGQCGWVF